MSEYTPPTPPPSKQDLKRQVREAKAVEKANRNWFARHKILTGLGVLVIIGIIGSMFNQADTGSAAPATGNQTTSSPGAASGDATEDPADEPAAVIISNGDHVVGTDIKAGQYRAEVEESIISLCTVSQTKDDDVLDIRNANEGSVIFTIQNKAGTVVSFSGCQNITLAADAVRAKPSAITNGDWLVGPEVAAGKYRGTVDSDAAIALGTIVQMSKSGDVLDIRNANEGSVVFTVKDSKGSIVSFSGLKDIKKA